jgi:hypothetical protein
LESTQVRNNGLGVPIDPNILATVISAPISTVAAIFAGRQQVKLAKRQEKIDAKQAQYAAEATSQRNKMIMSVIIGGGAVALAAILIYRSGKK